MKPSFSVVIPAFNEEELLPRLLESLSNQTYKDFEVILVDANSTDKTIEEAEKFSKKFPLFITSTTKKNVSGSRNLGASKAKGEYLFFIDADNYVRPSFLKEISVFVEKNYQMIIPAITPDSKNYYYKIVYKVANLFVLFTEIIKRSFSTGGNIIIKKDVFDALNGFDKTIFVGEDHDIVDRARKKGFRVTFASGTEVVFSARRLKKEGGIILLKYFLSTSHIIFFGKITKKMYNYEMGGDYYKKQK